MKKLFAAVAFIILTLALVSCSDRQSLDGEYYWIDESRNQLILTIKGEKGDLRSEGNHNLTVDKDSNTFEVSGFMNPTVKYKYKDGVLTANLGGVEQDYYKKGTQAYKDALKKFGQEEKE
ncbi:hypothetical protein [Streptococcus sanguinis]|uniref:hypothetical protein n=1 Tax=Streptococcus sanguinis TaxID=1305 RepID=UPI0031B5F6E0